MEIDTEVANPMFKLFSSFIEDLEKESTLRENIKKIVKDIEVAIRQQTALLQSIHNNPLKTNELCAQAKKHFPVIKEGFRQLQVLIGEEYYKYHDHWRNSISQIIFMAALMEWLESGNLLTIPELEQIIGVPGKSSENKNAFCVELDDYLNGLCSLPSELSRLAVNSVIFSNFAMPLKISKFVNELYNSFRLLNLKNDNLRKRYDGIKYDMKKIEEIVYDIKIRGLINT